MLGLIKSQLLIMKENSSFFAFKY